VGLKSERYVCKKECKNKIERKAGVRMEEREGRRKERKVVAYLRTTYG
jgi:hypothetical protein